MNYNLTLKRHFKYLTPVEGHELIGIDRVANQSIRIVILNTSIAFSLL